MEGAGEEPLPLFLVVSKGTISSARRVDDLVRHMVYTVFVLPVVGCDAALWLVVSADGCHETGVPHPRPLGHPNAYTCGHFVADQHGHGLLDIHSEATGAFLRIDHRDDSRSSLAMGIQMRS